MDDVARPPCGTAARAYYDCVNRQGYWAPKVSEPAVDDSCVIWDDGMIQGCAGNWLSKAIKQGGSARLDDAIAEEWRHAVAHDIDAVLDRVNYALQHGPGSEWASARLGGEGNYLVLVPKVSEPAVDDSCVIDESNVKRWALAAINRHHNPKYEGGRGIPPWSVFNCRDEGELYHNDTTGQVLRIAATVTDRYHFSHAGTCLVATPVSHEEWQNRAGLACMRRTPMTAEEIEIQNAVLRAEEPVDFLKRAESRAHDAECKRATAEREITELSKKLAASVSSVNARDVRISQLKERLNRAEHTGQGDLVAAVEHLKDRLKDAEAELTAEHDRDEPVFERHGAALRKRPVEPARTEALTPVSLSEDPDVRLFDQSHALAMLKMSNEHALAIRAVPMQVKAVYIGLGALLTMTLAQLSPLLN